MDFNDTVRWLSDYGENVYAVCVSRSPARRRRRKALLLCWMCPWCRVQDVGHVPSRAYLICAPPSEGGPQPFKPRLYRARFQSASAGKTGVVEGERLEVKQTDAVYVFRRWRE